MTEKKSNRPAAAATDVAEFITDLAREALGSALPVLIGAYASK